MQSGLDPSCEQTLLLLAYLLLSVAGSHQGPAVDMQGADLPFMKSFIQGARHAKATYQTLLMASSIMSD